VTFPMDGLDPRALGAVGGVHTAERLAVDAEGGLARKATKTLG
jgi:hypothetical protein